MTAVFKLALGVSVLLGMSLQVPACELVDLASAETLLGSGATEISGGADPSLCQYMDALGLSLVSVQVTEAEYYDLMGVPEPPTDIAIGERARYGTDEIGDVTLQFVKGEFHVSIKLAPDPDQPTPLEALEQVARTAADRLP